METDNTNNTGNGHDIILAHLSYEVSQTFMSLGFRETVIANNQPKDKNFYIVSGKGLSVHNENVLKSEDKTIIFNEQDRIPLRVNDRWDKHKIMDFVQNPESPRGIFREIKHTLKDYIEFPKEAMYGLITAWIIATYFHRCFHAFPFLFIYGKKQSGKSRLLDLLERLSFNAMKVKGVSVASLADSIDGIRGTFLNDQAEELSDKKNTGILGILTDSYTIGGGKRRIVNTSNNGRRVLEFETYGPKAFASIKEIDSDLKDRCIEITMLRAIREYPYPDAYLTVWNELRDRLYRLSLTRWKEVRELYQDTGKGVSYRMRELWRPIETVVRLEDVSGEEMEEMKGFFLESMQETQNELSEHEIKLFETLKEILTGKDKDILTASEIAEKFKRDYTAMSDKEKRGVQTWIGRTLNQLSLYDRHAGKKDGRKAYEFSSVHIENVYHRYKVEATSGDYGETYGLSCKSLPDNVPGDLETKIEEMAGVSPAPEREIEI